MPFACPAEVDGSDAGAQARAIAAAWPVHHARDWAAACARWEAIRAEMPAHPDGFVAGAVCLRELGRAAEAEALLQAAMLRFPDVAACAIEFAWLPHIRRDWQGALPRWIAVCERFPDQAGAWLRRAQAQTELWQYAAAEATLLAAMARFPDTVELAADQAGLAVRQGLWDVALERYGSLRARFPQELIGFTGAAQVLKTRFRLEEAEAMLEAAIAVFPGDLRLRLDHALLPVAPLFRNARRYDITLQRLARLRRDCPDGLDGFVTSVALLRELGQYDAAERVAAAWTGAPAMALALELARVAEACGDEGAAVARFRELCARFPDHPEGPAGLAAALSRSGAEDAAESVMAEAMLRFPWDAGIAAAYGQVAARRQDWTTALARWHEGQSRFPEDGQFAQRIYEAQNRLLEVAPDSAPPVIDRGGRFTAAADLSVSADRRQQMRALAMAFESLGGRDIGCEFGMVQRACGAEPLGLLRWADMPPEALMTALETRFAGVGTPEHTELFVDGLDRPEYCTRDRRGMMYARTFIYADEIPFGRMYAQSLRRLAFLTRKLIEDLAQGSKIFVYRYTRRDLTEAELGRLHAAMQGYGRNTLLYVRYADARHPPGSVVRAGDGLLVGAMTRFKVSRNGALDAVPPIDAWMAVCEQAYRLRKEALLF